MASDKIYTRKNNRHFFETTYGTFSHCNLAIEMSKRGKVFLKKWLFFFKKKRIKFELIRNITHQIKSLRESFILQKIATEAFHYPGYVIRLQKERQLQAKTKNYARKRCPLNQLNINLVTKNNKDLRYDCLKITTSVNQMTPIIMIL